MLETLISSKTRIKLLLKFFLNSKTKSYLRNLESEFGDSTNSIRVELNRLEGAGMLVSSKKGNKKIFTANVKHPLYSEVHNILLKYVGIDRIINQVVERLGQVEKVFLAGELSKGLDSKIIDLVFIGDIDKNYLVQLIEKVEKLISRKIRYLHYASEEFEKMNFEDFEVEPLLLWSKDD